MGFFLSEPQHPHPDGYNRRIILGNIISSREFTVPQIAERSGFSMTTVSKYVRDLHRNGMLEILDSPQPARKGRQAVVYRIKSDYCYFLGVDVKAFELNLGLMNLAGQMVHIGHAPQFCFDNTTYIVDEICSHIKEFVRTCGIDERRIALANFNLGGRVDSRAGTSASIFNFEENQETPLAVSLSRITGFPVTIENDSKAMAYGELMHLGNPAWKNILYVNAGWGIGLGIIINGELYYGKDGYAGEFGHIYQFDNNIMCHCGKKGCIETEISGRAIVRLLKERIYNHEASCLSEKAWNRDPITPRDLVEAAWSGDALCSELFMQTGRKLGAQLAGLINLFNPNCIILGGLLSEAPEACFLEPVKAAINKYSFSLMNQHMPVMQSALGHDAGVIGGCLIARNKTLAETLL